VRSASRFSGGGLASFLLAHASTAVIAHAVVDIDPDLKCAIAGYYRRSLFGCSWSHTTCGLVGLCVHAACALQRSLAVPSASLRHNADAPHCLSSFQSWRTLRRKPFRRLSQYGRGQLFNFIGGAGSFRN
jgi:hypothetical protein